MKQYIKKWYITHFSFLLKEKNMRFGQCASSVVLFAVLALALVDTPAVSAAVDSETTSIERAKSMVFDEGRSVMFVLNQDDTLSVYDFINKQFVFSRKLFSGVRNSNARLYSIAISPDGSKVAFFSSVARPTPSRQSFIIKVSLFRVEDILSNPSPVPTAVYTFSDPIEGQILNRFSEDGKILFVADGAGSILFLDTEKPRQESLAIAGGVLRMELDKYGRLLILKAGFDNLDVVDVTGKKVLVTIRLSPQPRNILFNAVTDKIYVTHKEGTGISVIDAEKLTVVRTVEVGSDPAAMTSDKNTGDIFVANGSEGTLSIINPDFQVKTIAIHLPVFTDYDRSSVALFYLNESKRLFITNFITAKLVVYDVARGEIVKEEKMSPFPERIFGSEKLGSVFIQHANADFIWEMDDKTLNTRHIPETGSSDGFFFSRPHGIAVDAGKNRIFVTNLGDNTITVIDGETQQPVTEIKVGHSPQIAIFQPVTKKLYSYSAVDDTVAVIDTTQEGYPVKIISTGKQPYGIAFNMETNRVYVSHAGAASISVIDGTRDEVTAVIDLPEGTRPSILSVNEKQDKIYAVSGSDFISVIDGKTHTVEKQITVGQNPTWVRYVAKVNRVFVAVAGEKKIAVIDPSNNEIVQTIDTGIYGEPQRILIDPRTGYVYINLRNSEKMLVVAYNKNSSSFRVIKEAVIPFFGQINAWVYNMLAVNEETGLAYFTSGANNNVVVVRPELGTDGVINPVWYATISADGDVAYSQEAKETLTAEAKKSPLASLLGSIEFLVAAIVIMIVLLGMVIFIKRKSYR